MPNAAYAGPLATGVGASPDLAAIEKWLGMGAGSSTGADIDAPPGRAARKPVASSSWGELLPPPASLQLDSTLEPALVALCDQTFERLRASPQRLAAIAQVSLSGIRIYKPLSKTFSEVLRKK